MLVGVAFTVWTWYGITDAMHLNQTGAVSLSGVRIASITVIIMQKGQPMSDKIDKVMGEITSVIDFDYMRIRSILTSVFGEQSIPQDIHTVIADYEEVLEDQKSLVRELDVLLNGDGAAQQASLCDIVGQVRAEHIRSKKYIRYRGGDTWASC